jgi:hypothetical protein
LQSDPVIREGTDWKQLRTALNPLFLGKNLLTPEVLRLLNGVSDDMVKQCKQQMNANESHLDVADLELMLDSYSIECESIDCID